MKLSKLLSADQILLDMQAEEHWPAIVELVDHLITRSLLPSHLRAITLDALKAREDMISTGIGAGVAIPHTFLDEIDHVTAVFGRSKRGIDFESHDQTPVHFIILFLVPQKNYQLHLQTLAAIAKLFNRREIRCALSESSSPTEILTALGCKPVPLQLPAS